MPPNSLLVAYVFEFMDQVFDSLNGPAPGDKPQETRVVVTEDSFHHEFWNRAKAELMRMRFVTIPKVENEEPTQVSTPSVKGLVATIQGYQLLWKILKSYGVQKMSQRNFIQDCLENYNGQAKGRGNKIPTCAAFDGNYKALMIMNVTSDRSMYGKNCMKDDGRGLFSWAEKFRDRQNGPRLTGVDLTYVYRPGIHILNDDCQFRSLQAILKEITVLKKFQDCEVCVESEGLTSQDDSQRHEASFKVVKEIGVDHFNSVIFLDYPKNRLIDTVLKKKTSSIFGMQ
ncbi:hypothetical protein QAD02_019988 [Eretmocerus hayati]|uniref:Uncharacterized protein n=1 Tax=Eretmocerus hayati TaxID=131215 RepID=A0ACC2PME4_9HYME|nr:hypothetical protein QAD02_019988 [Eretmocerus hayati]